jgi:glutamate-1-semialdehyde 2,1-aminomutase
MENKIVAIVQARLTSTRFPKKILQKIGNYSLIEILIHRLSQSKRVEEIILAIPNNKENNLLYNLYKNKFNVFKGDENDVLDRFYKAASKHKANIIVRICGDCPCLDYKTVDNVINLFLKEKLDYASNTIVPTFPDGLDVEVFSYEQLRNAWKNAKTPSEREHVTPYMLSNSKLKKKNFFFKKNLSHLRLTIDEKIDFDQIKLIFKKIKKKYFGINQIYKLYKKNKSVFDLNSSIKRNEGINLSKGQKLWKRAKDLIPGGNMLLSKRPEMFLPMKWPAYYKKAKGCFVWDLNNIKYKDLSLMSVGTNLLGYANSKVDNAVIKAIKQSNMSSLNCAEEVMLSEKLIDMHKHFDMVRYARTGGEANSVAVRIARAASGKDKIAVCGYHGWHDWYLSANLQSKEKDILKDHLLPGLSTKGVPNNLKNTIFPFKYNDFQSLEKICASQDIGTIKMEVFRNISPSDNFLDKVRKLADKKKIILIFDECTSGFRETFGGLHLKYNIKPDMCILGKALGNGFSIAAVLGRKEIMQEAQSTFISSTFWSERTGYVAALKTLEVMEKIKSWNIISNQGLKLNNLIKKISINNNLDVSFSGLSACPSYTIKSSNWMKYKTYITQEMLKNKFLAANTTYISIAHTNSILKEYSECLNSIFKTISECERDVRDIDKILEGPVCHSGFARLN